MTELEKLMVAAVRADPKVGRGTCSYVDETLSDDELVEMLREDGIHSETGALLSAREYESISLEQERNAGWGAPDDEP